MKKHLLSFVFFALILISPYRTEARDVSTISDWYIKDFYSEIVVNKDSSLDITEKITADCGNLPNKHGIYRVIPYQIYLTKNKTALTPIKLISIKDENGDVYQYHASNDRANKTVSWKIGDQDKTVSGENIYIIKYHVDNVIRTAATDFDELYWNLNGNFWEIETDKFTAEIKFPDDFDKNLSESVLYSGLYGEKFGGSSVLSWKDKKTMVVESDSSLAEGEGITLSLTYPKNYFSAYVAPWYIRYLWLVTIILPALFLLLSYLLWKKYGKDPSISPTIAPEFEIPNNLAPIEMGMIYSDGLLRNSYLSSGIIDLAVKGVIKIEEITNGKIFKTKDYKLVREKEDSNLPISEKELIGKLFNGSQTVKISSLKNKFYTDIPTIASRVKDDLNQKNLLIPSSRSWQYGFITIAIVLMVAGFSTISVVGEVGAGLMISALVVAIFVPIMTKRSEEGAKMYKRIQGFRLYMIKAELYRQNFNEKENIFEKFLPYAVMFGITNLWAQKMEKIYGKEYVQNNHPVWYYGLTPNFSFERFGDEISSMSSTIGSTISSSPSSSGSGGGGFSGGGGGGGGGGGW